MGGACLKDEAAKREEESEGSYWFGFHCVDCRLKTIENENRNAKDPAISKNLRGKHIT